MGKSRMEMIFIDSNDQARRTGVGAMMESDQATWSDFLSRKRLAVPIDEAAFLLDYYNRRGDLADTIPISKEGYTLITGEPVLTEAEYIASDEAHHAKLRKAVRHG